MIRRFLLDEELVGVNWFKKLVSAGRGSRLRLKYHWEGVLEERIEGTIWNLGVHIRGSRRILTKWKREFDVYLMQENLSEEYLHYKELRR